MPLPLKPDAPAFALTDEQRAIVDACRSDDSRTMHLQGFQQTHCYRHRDMSIFGMAADLAAFTRHWNANMAVHMAEAWGAYLAPAAAEQVRAAA